MNTFRLNIDGKEILGLPGQSILEAARANGIFIPTLCYDERTEIFGACGLCTVEVEGNPKLCRACATAISPGMVVMTNTDRVIESRKTNLELLISNHTGDCRPPCTRACPAGTDCQGYVGLIANGEYRKALELIRDKIPLPASIGRVCPHPCEDECRRKLVEEPIDIMELKRFAADYNMSEDVFIPETGQPTGKRVAVVGGGPLGLSAAYFLREYGHDVTIFDAMPKLGGMLRYGIPEYRLPKEVLDLEIGIIESMGVKMIANTKIGADISFDALRKDFDAVILGIGAWLSTGMGCRGEDAEGVMGGIDFLARVVRNEHIDLGKRVAVVGGGNTAMDACRTAVRLGAEEVYNVYRRTKDEMPADLIEINEAEEEGVIFKNLTNPLEIVKDENGSVKQVILQVMKLGDLDASGRRRPIPVTGKTETLNVDNVILAIGQRVDSAPFNVDKTRKNGIAYDPDTFMTSIPGVFAGGDCGNDKISIAIEAIADAKKIARIVDGYLNGEALSYRKPFIVVRTDVTEKTFEDRERLFREKAAQLSPEERKDNFSEIVYDGLTEEQAVREASRCLECGCHDYFECKLVDYANQYDVDPDRLAGEKHVVEYEDTHPFIATDPNKCILCGLCVRVCDEVMGVGALGFVHRGFDTEVRPTLNRPLLESGCESCGQCVKVCPVGALQERQTVQKEVPLDTESVRTTCPYCSVGCTLNLEYYGDMLIKSNPADDGYVNRGISCGRGKWGFDTHLLEDKQVDPLIKDKYGFHVTDYHEAFIMTAKKLESIKARYGENSIAVAISDRYTNEEVYAMKKFALAAGAKTFCFNNRHNALKDVLGIDASPNTIDEMFSTKLILAVGFQKKKNPVIWNKMMHAAKGGVKVVAVNTPETDTDFGFADKVVETDNTTAFLEGMVKALMDAGCGKNTEGYDELASSVAEAEVTGEVKETAGLYMSAKKAMIVFQQNILSVEAATLLADMAVLSGHIGKPRDGILLVKPKNNSQGLIDMGIRDGKEAMEGVKGLAVFGEDPVDADFSGVEFLMVSDVFMTDTAEKSDVFIPATGFTSADGTYTNTERRLLPVKASVSEHVVFSNWEVASALAHAFEEEFGFENEPDISAEMNETLPQYKYASMGEILGGVLTPRSLKLTPAKGAKLTDELPCTDVLMNMTTERIPPAVKVK